MPATTGALDAIDASRTMLTTGADDLQVLVSHVVALGVEFVGHEPAASRDECAAVARRLAAAAAPR